MKHLFYLSLLLLLPTLSAQEVTVVFQPVLGGVALEVAEEGGAAGAEEVKKSHALNVETLRFYLSDVVLLKAGAVVHRAAKKHHLIDAERPKTLRLPLQTVADYDELRFTFGVDSLTAASGAFGADLDGMYWTWRSGYINFKLEGTSPDCPARKNRFQFHVGGFQGPFNSEREVSLRVSPDTIISVQIDLDHFFAATDLSTDYQIMSPSAQSAALADLLVALFRINSSPKSRQSNAH
jgi:hypothetical protein